ncbi:acylphosphatase [Cricetibacter osteomyelitidis]|uniref:acylphosphatase n=1 Tax=Cricetibacter osteomyelitidis TaxID=1521931 RepID=UPI00104D9CA1|nr:acylphosphatase [Cricetibacter osteomyelitidis]
MIRKQFSVYGRVQGVSFRFFTLRKAQKIGVSGIVRNLSDGSVQVIAEGSEQQIETLYQWLQQGPKTAKVDQVIMQDYMGNQTFESFEITRFASP